MKIRFDYVSNSSSSSFMLVGKACETWELKEIFKNSQIFKLYMENHSNDISNFEEDEEDNEENFDTCSNYDELDEDELDSIFWEEIDGWLEEYGLSYHVGLENYGEDTICIGMNYEDMKENETKSQFEQRIKESLDKLFGESTKIECMIDGGYEL